MKGYRKLILAFLILIIALVLIYFDKFNDVVSSFLQWLYGLFATSNILEHTIEKYERRKKEIDNSVNNLNSDELKSRVEDAIKDKDK